MNHLAAVDVEIIRTRVAVMLRERHFSICAVDALLKLTGGVPDRRTYDRLHALHCVNYADMTPALRVELPRMLQIVLESRPVEYTYMPPAETPTERLLN